MRMMMIRTSTMILISLLSACSSMSGNVVPQSGPSMEQVYDGMSAQVSDKPNGVHLLLIREKGSAPSSNAFSHEFYKLPNPELKMYVFPHLAGKDEVPIPGYFTQFNAYTQDHYVLPDEIARS